MFPEPSAKAKGSQYTCLPSYALTRVLAYVHSLTRLPAYPLTR